MRDLTEGNIYKTFILFAIPMVLAGFLSQAYHIVNTIIAGRFLGEEGLAAIGATAALISLISSAFWGYGAGFSIYVARLFGAKEYKKIKSAIYSNCLVMLIAAVVIAAASIIFYKNIFDLLRIEEGLRYEAFLYFAICMVVLFPTTFNAIGVHIMNALGISTYPLYMSVVSTVMNIVGSIFAVAVLEMGVAGLAISTGLASVTITICYFCRIYKCFKEMKVEKEKVEIGLDIVKESIVYSVPTMAQQMIMYVASFAISPLVNGIGSAGVAAYTVVLRIYDINAGIYQNSAKTLSNFTAQCIGAKKYEKIKKGVRVGLLQGIVFVLPALLICSVFAEPIDNAFFPDGYVGEGFGLAVVFSRIYLPFILINLINNLFHSFFRGTKAMGFLMLSTLIGTVARISASYVLANIWGMHGVYAGWVISWAVEAIFAVSVYISGKWKPLEMRGI